MLCAPSLQACYDGESSCPLLRSNSATRVRIAARRSSPNVRASARACARLADAARCRASGIVCNDNNAGAKPTTIDCGSRDGESQCEERKKRVRTARPTTIINWSFHASSAALVASSPDAYPGAARRCAWRCACCRRLRASSVVYTSSVKPWPRCAWDFPRRMS